MQMRSLRRSNDLYHHQTQNIVLYIIVQLPNRHPTRKHENTSFLAVASYLAKSRPRFLVTVSQPRPYAKSSLLTPIRGIARKVL